MFVRMEQLRSLGRIFVKFDGGDFIKTEHGFGWN